jgi:DNA-directed RNA polymerase specialized sigma24 family protein
MFTKEKHAMSTNLHPETRSELREYLQVVESTLEHLKKGDPSMECILLRMLQAYFKLQLKGYSEHVADAASNAARDAAIKAIASGAVWNQCDRGAWFWTCASNAACGLANDERLYNLLIKSGPLPCRADHFDPDVLNAMRPLLRNALKTLSRQHRVAVLRRYAGDASINAVARKLKIGIRRAKRYLSEGLVCLRQSLLAGWEAQMAIWPVAKVLQHGIDTAGVNIV